MPTSTAIRHFLRPTIGVLIASAVLACLRWGAAHWSHGFDRAARGPLDELAALGADRLLLPTPDLTPEQVVRTQLAGLADPAPHGIGILQCFAFASPGNRAVTGPIDRFGQMVRRGAFSCLAQPEAILIGRAQLEGPVARVLVTVIDDQRNMQAFYFILSRQGAEPFAGCWMTEAVFPTASLALEAAASPRPPYAA